MTRTLLALLAASALSPFLAGEARAFCGFYVAQADSKLFNEASKVVLAHDGQDTSITMASDYKGEAKDFAVVIPVPSFVTKDRIHIVPPAMVEHIDAYTAPRLVDLPDPDPCYVPPPMVFDSAARVLPSPPAGAAVRGVTVEAQYEVGEYDIEILSATQSDGLIDYLTQNHYRIPEGASAVLSSYIRQGMHFFIAKVNLARMEMMGGGFIRPLQVRYTSPKFMLPLRLGTVNARGPQDLIIYALTKEGRVETSNYRTIKMPTSINLPPWVRDDFGAVYKAAFEKQVEAAGRRGVFLEYAWNLNWCDPCSSSPIIPDELATLGAAWIDPRMGGGGSFVTRLHVRYDAAHFPEDLQLQETRDQESYQVRYILRKPWRGAATCPAALTYLDEEPAREAQEARNLAELTGWHPGEIRREVR